MADDLWARQVDVVWRRSGSRLLVRVVGDDELIVMDRTGLVLWQELEHPSSLPALAGRIADRYDVAPEQVACDLEPVLEHLERRHAVRRCA